MHNELVIFKILCLDGKIDGLYVNDCIGINMNCLTTTINDKVKISPNMGLNQSHSAYMITTRALITTSNGCSV
jgi:hypothetical protein